MDSFLPKDSKSREWGKQAEMIACDYLISEGYVVRERNWSPEHSHLEVDIIAEIPGTIVFVEVKARKRNGNDAALAVDTRKQKRIAKAADKYLRALEHCYEYRFDIIAITGNAKDYNLEHLSDAFLAPLSS